MCGELMNLSDMHLFVLEKGEVSCSDVEALMSDYVDNDMAPSVRRRLEHHMAQCESCSQCRSDFLTIRAVARELGARTETLPAGVEQRLRLALQEQLGISLVK